MLGTPALIIRLEDGGVPGVAPHLVHVHDEAAVLLQEVCDVPNILAGAGPRVLGQVEAALGVDAGAPEDWLQGGKIQLVTVLGYLDWILLLYL